MHVIHQNVLIFSNITDYPTLYLESKNLYMVKKRGSWISTNACVFLNLIFRGAYPTTQGGRFLVRIRTWVTWITGNHQPGAWKNHRQHQQLLPLVSNKGSCFGQGHVFDGMVPRNLHRSAGSFGDFFLTWPRNSLLPLEFWSYHEVTISQQTCPPAMDMSHHLYTTILVVWFWASAGFVRRGPQHASWCLSLQKGSEDFFGWWGAKFSERKTRFIFCVKINATLTQAELPWDLVNIISTYL